MKRDTINKLKIAYIGGGSRGWAWGFMKDLALDEQLSGTVYLYDIDKDAAEKNMIIGNKISAHPDVKSPWKYEVSDSLQTVLSGADVVVISILPGTFEEMRSDVHAPEKYGIWQSVGDTVGPGGFIRAMRTIPMFVEIAEAIKAFSPEAWVINYTNPMSLCIRTLYEVFPKIKAFGCCHEVFGTQKLLASMLEDMKEIKDVTRQEIKTNVLSINHFTWFDKAVYEDIDLFPLYEEFADKYYTTGFAKGLDDNWMNNSFACSHRVKFDLFKKYGLIAAAGDRHLAEFMPPWYLKNPETVKSWGFGLTTVDFRVEQLAERIDQREKLVSGETPVTLDASGEEGHLLIKALLGLGEIVSNVNIPNQGQIANLPIGAVVETNALFRNNELSPMFAGEMPANLLPLVSRHIYNQENTMHAAMDCDFKLAFTTFMNDPMTGDLTPLDGEELLKSMLYVSRKYLPIGWKF